MFLSLDEPNEKSSRQPVLIGNDQEITSGGLVIAFSMGATAASSIVWDVRRDGT
jgi:hypothetical protein